MPVVVTPTFSQTKTPGKRNTQKYSGRNTNRYKIKGALASDKPDGGEKEKKKLLSLVDFADCKIQCRQNTSDICTTYFYIKETNNWENYPFLSYLQNTRAEQSPEGYFGWKYEAKITELNLTELSLTSRSTGLSTSNISSRHCPRLPTNEQKNLLLSKSHCRL